MATDAQSASACERCGKENPEDVHTCTPSPAATWDAMSEQQKVEWLATEVMAWKQNAERWPDYSGEMSDVWKSETAYIFKHKWNPLTDWNHWRQVEEKVIEDEQLTRAYVLQAWGKRSGWPHWVDAIHTDQPTRARALYLAMHV